MKFIALAIVWMLCSVPYAVCGDIPSNRSVVMKDPAHTDNLVLTGNLRTDLFTLSNSHDAPLAGNQVEDAHAVARKSSWLAAGMSLVVPGSGEFYATNYWRSALFFALEVTVWTVAYTYDKKGDRQTDFFENYADKNWNVIQYATHAQTLAPAGTYNWFISGREGLPPWEQVDWAELNRMERDIGATSNGRYYSHSLPRHGEQQYYELIGKYYQYNQGWQDIVLAPGVEGQLNLYYERERAHADDFYQTASTMVSIGIVNHLLSAVDAALCATSFNKAHASVGHKMIPDGPRFVLTPVVKFSYDL